MHVLTPAAAPRGLVLLAPGGGQDHTSPHVAARAEGLTGRGWTVAVFRSIDAVPSVLSEHPGPVGLWGLAHGCRVSLPLLAAEPRIVAAVLGLADGPLASAPLVTAAVRFHLQLDDEVLDPAACRRLFEALGSTDKTLVEEPGGHLAVPPASAEASLTWLERRLTRPAGP